MLRLRRTAGTGAGRVGTGLATGTGRGHPPDWPDALRTWAERGPRPPADVLHDARTLMDGSGDWFATVYEHVVAGPNRRRLGTFFTPPGVVDLMCVSCSLARGPKRVMVRGCDGGCGSPSSGRSRSWRSPRTSRSSQGPASTQSSRLSVRPRPRKPASPPDTSPPANASRSRRGTSNGTAIRPSRSDHCCGRPRGGPRRRRRALHPGTGSTRSRHRRQPLLLPHRRRSQGDPEASPQPIDVGHGRVPTRSAKPRHRHWQST